MGAFQVSIVLLESLELVVSVFSAMSVRRGGGGGGGLGGGRGGLDIHAHYFLVRAGRFRQAISTQLHTHSAPRPSCNKIYKAMCGYRIIDPMACAIFTVR